MSHGSTVEDAMPTPLAAANINAHACLSSYRDEVLEVPRNKKETSRKVAAHSTCSYLGRG